MDSRMLKCQACASYTFREICPSCGKPTGSPHPHRFSPEDRYGKYRRRLKRLAQEEAGK